MNAITIPMVMERIIKYYFYFTYLHDKSLNELILIKKKKKRFKIIKYSIVV